MNNIEAKNYVDESTTENFNFVFHCDCCRKIILEFSCANQNNYKSKLFQANQKEKEILWKTGHDVALFKARQKALEELNRCEVCGKLVCDDCIVESDDLKGGICCKNCLAK